TYTISDDSGATDTATVNLTVSAPATGNGLVSDDFSGGALDPAVWSVEGPAGISAGLGITGSEAYLELVTPDGNYDAWQTNNSARAMQDIVNEDFQVEARFLTTPADRFQLHGLLVEQDADNWVRFDTYSDGTVLRVFSGVTVNGSSSSRLNMVIQPGDAEYLRVARSGDTWTYQYSADGANWTTAVSYTHALNATSAGVFAGNVAQATGYTAQVDYFEVSTDPIANEDGSVTPVNTAPEALNDNYVLESDRSLTVDAASGVLDNDSDADGDPLTATLDVQAAKGTVVLNADGSFTYTPDAGSSGSDSFTYTLSDGTDTGTATVTLSAPNPGGGGPLVQDAPVLTTGTPGFTKVIVTTAMPLTHVGIAADFDQDGDIDIAATSEQNDSVVWYENDGAENFTAHVIDSNLESSYPAAIADLDQDGDADILAAGYREDLYVWYENDGSGSFQRHTIAAKDGAHYLEAADIDGDGDLDLVTASQDAATIAWYENDGAQNFTEHVLDSNALEAKTAIAFDIDGDGDLDILTASHGDDTVAVYENDGSQTFTKQVVDSAADGAYYVTAADLNGDGLTDIAAAAKLSNQIIGYFSTGSGYTKTVLATSVLGARTVIAEDVDNDGDIDLLAASVGDDSVRFLENDGSGVFGAITIDGTADGAYTPTPADVNQDGLTDVIAASKTDATVAVLLQHREHSAVMNAGESLAIDASLLAATDTEQSASELVYTLVSAPALGALRLNGSDLAAGGSFTQADVNQGLVSFATTAGTDGPDGFELGLSDGISAPAKVVFDVTIGTPASGSGLVSDDFSGGALDPAVWSVEGPAGVAANLASNAADAYLELVTPDGNYDAWQTNNSARAMQDIADEDFQIEARFLSTPAERFQLHGLLVEQDANNWLRFDTYSDGTVLRVFAAVTVNGSSSSRVNAVIQAGDAEYLRVDRSGDTWTYEYSADGINWTTAVSFTHAVTAASAGVFAGNTAQATGYTAQIDYFEVAHDPIADEDGSHTPPANQAPDAVDDGLAVGHDTALVIDQSALLSNDSDPDGDPITFDSFTNPSNGTLLDNGDGTLTYTPNAGYEGPDSFTYTISDDSGLTDTATVNLTVSAAANQAPDAVDDGLAVGHDTALVIDQSALLSNDSDPDGDPVTFDSFTNPSNGTLADNGDGTLTYTPNAGYEGPDSFTYTISDDSGATDTATVNLTVAAPPSGSGLVSDDFSGAALDPAVWSVEGPAGISAALGSNAGEFYLELVTPDGFYDAWKTNNSARAMQDVTDTDFEIEARFLTTPADRFQLHGLLVEQDANNWLRFDTYSDGTVLRVFSGVTINGSSSSRINTVIQAGDAEYLRVARSGDTWTYQYSADGTNWTTAVSYSHAITATSAGVFAGNVAQASGYTAQVDYFEVSTDPIVNEDGGGTPPPNQAPDAVDDGLAVVLDTALVIDESALMSNDSDPDGDPVTFDSFTNPSNGTLTDNGDGTLTYTPNAGYEGPDSFTYTISDDGGLSDTATVNLTVSAAANQAPDAVDDGLAVGHDTALVIDQSALLSNDSDPDGDPVTFDSFTNPSNGTLADNGDGTLTYTPNAGYEGPDSFTYTISDDSGLSDTATVNLTVAAPPSGSGLVSDDFAGGPLDLAVWSVEGPAGISAATGGNANDAFLELVTPDGNFDAWGTNNSARAMQDVSDVDFEIEARFLSMPSERFQLHGLLVEQDANNWLRFDTYSDGTVIKVFAAVTTNGSSSSRVNMTIQAGDAEYLRVNRSGDTWTYDYSADGSNWTTAVSFNHAITASSAGVFAGNVAQATGYTAQVDYFEVASDPIADEDGSHVPVNTAPDAQNDAMPVAIDTALVIATSSLLANDSDPDGDPITFDSFTSTSNGTLTDNGDGTLTYTPNAGYEGPDSFTYTISDDGGLTDTATVDIAVGPVIDVWYGPTQTFGQPGEAQTWVNILGDVFAEDIDTLTYRLNGGAERNLSVGPDAHRLEKAGDFNIDIAYDELDPTAADDVVSIIARYNDGSEYTQDVTIQYQDGAAWPEDYSIDWSAVSNIQDVAQVVDGKWTLTGDGVRPDELGFDRFIAIGDNSWDFYEARLAVTPHDLSAANGLFGFGLWWNGHTSDSPIQWQPLRGFTPSEFLFYDQLTGTPHFEIYPSTNITPFTLAEDTRFNFVIRVEQSGTFDRSYKMKVWEEGTAEPAGWLMDLVIDYDDPITGSFALVTHHYDIEFHDIDITGIEGGDVTIGDDSAEVLAAVDAADPLPGLGELDVFTGNGGDDVFVFGDNGTVYYDDGNGATSGEDDYGYVWDFSAGDKVRLAGTSSDYVLSEDAAGLPGGTAIWLAGSGGDQDELIGILHNVYGLSLTGDAFEFTGLV
ncbi:cadherin-like domain-containing protein, partial [Leisingera sp. ANG-M7]|uniref:cadherin-like domain-containing protein n=1 Tax=Leisingera sp. ANG-M7 TaxID=1577902 RepID=UPI000580296D